jgi:hypothetical protein
MNRKQLPFIGLALLVLGGAITFPLWRPLVVNDVVDEGFPAAFSVLPADQQSAFREMREENPDMASTLAAAAVVSVEAPAVEQVMPDMPPEPLVVSAGSFIEIDAIHGAEGSATIYQLPDGSHLLRFEDFRSTNGPDLRVLLSAHPDPRSHDELGADYIELGQLKGNVGNQNYDLPADIDLSQYRSVVIYCQPFQVVFSTATLAT